MKIRADILRVYLSLHSWVGIVAGLLLFIGFFAGALTVFKTPLARWSSPPALQMPSVSAQQYDTLIREVVRKHPEAQAEFTLHLQAREHQPAPLSWSNAEAGHELDLTGKLNYASLNQDNSLVVKQEPPSLIGELIDMLHRTGGVPGLLGDEYAGIYLMGIAGVLYFLALVSGLIIYLPVFFKDLFALRPGKNRKRFWQDAHNLLGVFSLPFHLLISVTVIVFAFHDLFYGSLARWVYGEQAMFQPPPMQSYAAHRQLLPVQQVLEIAHQQAPQFTVSDLNYLRLDSPRPALRIALNSPDYLVQGAESTYLMIDPYNGAILNNRMVPEHANSWNQLVAPLFSLHFASYGGSLMRWVYFLMGISGAMLFYTGNLLWVEKRRKAQARASSSNPDPAIPQQTRATRIMAALTVGVSLGSVLAVACALVSGKWAYLRVENLNYSYLWVYYLVFLGACSWSLYRGAAQSAYDLLRACVVAGLSIPASSLLAWLLPASGLWVNTSLASLTVDMTALLLALAFAWLARLTRRRIVASAQDSVWTKLQVA